MPIYEYVCRNCGRELEKLQKMSDAPLTDCPACGKAALKRKVSAAAFRLAGSGWYETDFKSGNRHNIAGDGGKPDTASNGSAAASAGKDGAKDGSKAGSKKNATDASKTGSKGAATT